MPVAYFKFGGVMYAMTATEAACYDKMLNGALRSKMVSLTNKNLPLSMFLQTADLGYPAWAGSTTAKQDDSTIINALGIGIIYFDAPPEPSEVISGDLEYHTDTDVVTSIYVSSPYDYTPDSNKEITITAYGASYTEQFICPKGGRQMIWLRWHTPSTPQTVMIAVSGAASGAVTANIVGLEENEPPNPNFSDSNKTFRLSDEPTAESNLSTAWYKIYAKWVSDEGGGHWEFRQRTYSATLDVNYNLTPAARVQTEYDLGFGDWKMKSGYGVEADVAVTVSGEGGVSSSDVTPAQHVEALFPEFGYETYNRFLTPVNSATYNTSWHFKPNRYSYYSDPVHFTPLWYPDGTDYPVPITVEDAWTPDGTAKGAAAKRPASFRKGDLLQIKA